MTARIYAMNPGGTPFDRAITDSPPEGGGGGGPPEAPPPPDGEAADFGPVVPLGVTTRRERTVCVFLDASGRRVVLDARALHQRATLDLLFGGVAQHQFLIDRWPQAVVKRGKAQAATDWDPERLGSALMSACLDVGDADSVKLRRDGTWAHGKGLMFHAGDRVFIHDQADGGGDDVLREERPGWRDGSAIYIATGKRARPAARAATVREVKRLTDSLNLWRYADPEAGPKIMMGNLFAGMVAHPLAWRPAVIVRGVTNAGKSSLVNMMAAAAGADAPPKSLTGAALQRGYDMRSGLIALDEQEAAADSVARVVEIMRGASDGEGNTKIQMDDGGGMVSFTVCGVFLLGAISPPPLNDADESRITLVHLLRPDVDRRMEVETALADARALHPALLRRALDAWPRYQAAWRVARAAAGGREATARSSDQLGALLAGWWVMTKDEPLHAAEADEEMGRLLPFLTTRTAAAQVDTAMLVLQHLLSSRVPMKERSSDQITVVAAIGKAWRAQHRLLNGGGDLADDARGNVEFWKRQLGSWGLSLNAFGQEGRGWPWPFDGKPSPGLLIADGHQLLDHLFRGSPWQNKAWLSPLLDLPGARKGATASFPDGGVHRARFVPLAALGLDEEALLDVYA
jgi:hypothetical protein